ncbi:MAG: hypothetical protein K6G83_00655 [Lachnospiraceae bacterium]|nr:hypothetical protein [Lachnospiraceae bacterium]
MKKTFLTGVMMLLLSVLLTACGDSGDVMELDEDTLAMLQEAEANGALDPDDLPKDPEISAENPEIPAEAKDSGDSGGLLGQFAQTKTPDADDTSDDLPVLWSSFNTYGVENKPEAEYTTVVFDEECRVTAITTYHWNDGNGAEPGKIALMQGNERLGVWEATGREGSGAQNVNWDVFPDIVLKPGEYQVYDSDPETWSCNEASGYIGFVEIRGEAVSGDDYFDGPYGDVFDLSEYEDEWIGEYGGDLEEKLAERLQTRVAIGDDGDSKVICDGAIEFYPAVNGSGFFVWVYEPVDGFSVYGISVGMPEDNAIANLEANNLSKEDDGENGVYSSDFDKFYVRYDAEDGIITKVTYVKIYEQ